MAEQWTIESLKAHYDQRFADQEKAVNAALAAAEKAVTKAENAAERRFDSVNEFRAQLSDQAATFMPRAEYERAHLDLIHREEADVKALVETIAEVKDRVGRIESVKVGAQEQRQGFSSNVGIFAAVIGLIFTIISIVLVVGDVLTP